MANNNNAANIEAENRALRQNTVELNRKMCIRDSLEVAGPAELGRDHVAAGQVDVAEQLAACLLYTSRCV